VRNLNGVFMVVAMSHRLLKLVGVSR